LDVTSKSTTFVKDKNTISMASTEDNYIRIIEGAIRGIKMGTKTPEQVDVTAQFNRLKPLNPMMWEDLQEKYKFQVAHYNANKGKPKTFYLQKRK